MSYFNFLLNRKVRKAVLRLPFPTSLFFPGFPIQVGSIPGGFQTRWSVWVMNGSFEGPTPIQIEGCREYLSSGTREEREELQRDTVRTWRQPRTAQKCIVDLSFAPVELVTVTGTSPSVIERPTSQFRVSVDGAVGTSLVITIWTVPDFIEFFLDKLFDARRCAGKHMLDNLVRRVRKWAPASSS